MTDSPGAILTKLEALGKKQDRIESAVQKMDEGHDQRLLNIEHAISLMAVQNEKLIALKEDSKVQWEVLEEHSRVVEEFKIHKARCPTQQIKIMDEALHKAIDFQIACPAKSTKTHLWGMWIVLTLIGGMVATIFSTVITHVK